MAHSSVLFSARAPVPKIGHCWPMPPLATPGHSQTSLAPSLVGSLLLSPGSWCTSGFVCSLQESDSSVLWKFHHQISLALKVKLLGGSQFLCWIPSLGNLSWALELSQWCENFFGIVVFQFVGCLLNGSLVGLMATSSMRTCNRCRASQVCGNQSLCTHGRLLGPMPPQETLKHLKAGRTQSLVEFLGPGAHKVLFAPSKHLCVYGLWSKWNIRPNILLRLLLCPWTWSIFFGGIQHSPVDGCSAVSCNFRVLWRQGN